MGHSTIFDIIGSFGIGGLLFLMALRLNASAVESSSAYYSNFILQTNITTLISIIEEDFSKIAYCKTPMAINPASVAMRVTDSTRFRFLTDVDNNGTVDSIEYYTGATSELINTSNPNDRYLYRRVNTNSPQPINLGITQFKFNYRKSDDETLLQFPIADPTAVGVVELSIALESAEPMQQEYMNDTTQYQIFWKQIRLTSKNLRYR